MDQLLTATTLSLPGISSQTCKAAIEGIVTPIAGVGAVDVDVPTKTITIHHDNRAPARRLIEAIEDQGYHVAEAFMTTAEERTGNHDSRGIEAVHTTETAGPGPRHSRPVRCRMSKPLSKPDCGSSMVPASDQTRR
jgi:copper chaperone CopZ